MRILLTSILIFTFQISFGQSGFINSPMVIGNAGETWFQNDYNLSFTVGQIAIETYSQNQTIFTQGFHQDSYQITQLNNLNTNFDISIFPNPTSDNINIDYNINNARADLFIKDIRGATIYYSLDFSTNKRQTIDISKFAPGVYVLEIILNSKNKIVYQIQKLN
ncbi:MAG: hypothetical protein CMP56_01335 [Flavobacteriales bacterium]|nr:hypothetical protein [Flavobacteriales bacterium]